MAVQNSNMIEDKEAVVLAIFALPAVNKRLVELGITHTGMSSKDYTKFVSSQITMWAPLIISSGIVEK